MIKKAFKELESWLHQDSKTPAEVFEALHILWEEIESKPTKEEISHFVMNELVNCKDEEQMIGRLCDWLEI